MKICFAGWLMCLLAMTPTPSLASDHSDENRFRNSFLALEKKYNAPEITNFFDRAQKNLDEYFSAILNQRIAHEHSDQCIFRYREALDDARHHSWDKAKTQIEKAKKESKDPTQHPCIADIWMASALIDKSMSNYEGALADFGTVYEARKTRPDSWTKDSDIFNSPPCVRFPQ